MKATVGVFTKEGFVSGLAIQLENGLLLRNAGRDVCWLGQDEKQELYQKFDEFLAALEQAGFELDRAAYDEEIHGAKGNEHKETEGG